MAMIEGWLLDVHANHDNTGMTAWVVDDEGLAHACEVCLLYTSPSPRD